MVHGQVLARGVDRGADHPIRRELVFEPHRAAEARPVIARGVAGDRARADAAARLDIGLPAAVRSGHARGRAGIGHEAGGRRQRLAVEQIHAAEQGAGEVGGGIEAEIGRRRDGFRGVQPVGDIFAEDREAGGGEVNAVDIEEILALQRRIADAGQRADAGAGEAVARRIHIDHLRQRAHVDIFDAHAASRHQGELGRHQAVVGLAIGGGDAGDRRAGRLVIGQDAGIAGGPYEGPRAGGDQGFQVARRQRGASRCLGGNAGDRSAGMGVIIRVIAADVDEQQRARRNGAARSEKAGGLLGEARNGPRNVSGGRAAPSQIEHGQTIERAQRVDIIGSAAETAGRIDRRQGWIGADGVAGVDIGIAEGDHRGIMLRMGLRREGHGRGGERQPARNPVEASRLASQATSDQLAHLTPPTEF